MNTQITARNAASISSGVAVEASLGSSIANTTTVADAMTAASSPRPPSSSPYARPWLATHAPFASRRSMARQKSRIEVRPQNAQSPFITGIEGTPASTAPPSPVATSAAAIRREPRTVGERATGEVRGHGHDAVERERRAQLEVGDLEHVEERRAKDARQDEREQEDRFACDHEGHDDHATSDARHFCCGVAHGFSVGGLKSPRSHISLDAMYVIAPARSADLIELLFNDLFVIFA